MKRALKSEKKIIKIDPRREEKNVLKKTSKRHQKEWSKRNSLKERRNRWWWQRQECHWFYGRWNKKRTFNRKKNLSKSREYIVKEYIYVCKGSNPFEKSHASLKLSGRESMKFSQEYYIMALVHASLSTWKDTRDLASNGKGNPCKMKFLENQTE